jgi:hypothetical protein
MRMFFWFNAAFIGAIAVINVLFDSFGGFWVILPLIFVAGFVTHAVTVHVYWTIRLNTYSSGFLSSLLYVIVFYLLIRYWRRGPAHHSLGLHNRDGDRRCDGRCVPDRGTNCAVPQAHRSSSLAAM